MIFRATVCFIILTFLWVSASFKVMVGSYFAWIGQIGMQLVLPAQARRLVWLRIARGRHAANGDFGRRRSHSKKCCVARVKVRERF